MLMVTHSFSVQIETNLNLSVFIFRSGSFFVSNGLIPLQKTGRFAQEVLKVECFVTQGSVFE